MAKQDGLFLLEVLIDKVTFDQAPCFADKEFRTCVSIECPTVPPLEICEDESTGSRSSGPFSKSFNSGKSCLFSMKEEDINKGLSKFPVKIQVYKCLPCGCIPTKIVMGAAEIDMTKEFVETRNKHMEDPFSISFQALKDKFQLSKPDGKKCGEIMMYLRISCFGSQIVTKFRRSDGGMLIGSQEEKDSAVDRSCDGGRAYQTPLDPCVCGASHSAPNKSGSLDTGICPEAKGGAGICPHAKDPYSSMPCEEPDEPCFCCGPRPAPKQDMACRNIDPYCLHLPKDCCPPGNKVIFQMPADSCGRNHKQRMHYNLTSDGTGDVTREEPGALIPTTHDDYPGVVYDMGNQVIKLRVGKTYEEAGRKSKLEYQFITPVPPTTKEIATSEPRYAQCDPLPCEVPSLSRLQDLPGDFEPTNMFVKLLIAENVYNIVDNTNKGNGAGAPAVLPIEDCQMLYDQGSYSDSNSTASITRSVSVLSASTDTFIYTSDTNSCSSTDYKKNWESKNFPLNNTVPVYMTLCNETFYCRRQTGVQASALINKCLQVALTDEKYIEPLISIKSAVKTNIPAYPSQKSVAYFFGTSTCKKCKKCNDETRRPAAKAKSSAIQTNYSCCQTSQTVKQTASTNTKKSVSLAKTPCQLAKPENRCMKENCIATPPECKAVAGDLTAVVSYVRIGPDSKSCRGPCRDSCKKIKCVVQGNQPPKAPVKVTNINNPRRGVFEIVIRRLTGAPLATNELMLEWTPPPNIPCGANAFTAPSKSKLVICRPPSRIRCCKKPCRPCTRCCSKPCVSPRLVTRPPPCIPPCFSVCKKPCGVVPCSSSPCLRACRSRKRRLRRCRSQKIKPHPNRTSPCFNKCITPCCSLPTPCIFSCPPLKCCQPSRCGISSKRKFFKSPCASSCQTCGPC